MLQKAVLFAAALPLCFAADPGAGRWEGTIRIPGRELPIIVDLAKDGGAWVGSAIVPGFDIKGTPLSEIAVNGADVSFAFKYGLGRPKFKGRLDGATLTGDYTQAGNTAPFVLQNMGDPQVDLPKQSTTISKQIEGEWQGDMTFAGSPMHAVLKLANGANGKSTGQLVLDKNALPIDVVIQDGGTLTLELTPYQISFEGRIGKDAGEISGTFTQFGFEAQLNFKPAAGAKP